MKAKKPNTPAAMLKVREALKLIESAQTQMDFACMQLSTLRYGVKKHDKALQLYSKLQAFWYEVRDFAAVDQSLSTDSEPETR